MNRRLLTEETSFGAGNVVDGRIAIVARLR